MLLWAGLSVQQLLWAGQSFSDVAFGWTVNTVTFVGCTFIIAMFLWAGQSVQQLFWAGHSVHQICELDSHYSDVSVC